MSSQAIIITAHLVIILGALLTIIYTFGVVWRVEKKLDLFYKLLLGAIISFTLSELFSLFQFEGRDWVLVASIALQALFIILFLAGILEVRNMLQRNEGKKALILKASSCRTYQVLPFNFSACFKAKKRVWHSPHPL